MKWTMLVLLILGGLAPTLEAQDCGAPLVEVGRPAGPCQDGCGSPGRPITDGRVCRPELTGLYVQVHPCKTWELGRVRVRDYQYDGRTLRLTLTSPCHPGQVRVWASAPVGAGEQLLATWKATPGAPAVTTVEARKVLPHLPADRPRWRMIYLTWPGVGGAVQVDAGHAFVGGPAPRSAQRKERGHVGASGFNHDLTEVGASPRWMSGTVRDFRVFGDLSPLHGVLEDLAEESDHADAKWWAGELAGYSGGSLGRLLCRTVSYSRTFPAWQGDPAPDRDRSGKEIRAWLLDLTGPTRPAQARMFRPTVELWPEADLKRWHDKAKAAWTEVAAAACPELEP
jgi:hypothetical protein